MTMTFIENNYELVENYKDGFVFNELESKFTDYFYDYDYVLVNDGTINDLNDKIKRIVDKVIQ